MQSAARDTIPAPDQASQARMSTEVESLTSERSSRRTGNGISPMLFVFAGLALLLAAYAHWRFEQYSDRSDRFRNRLGELQSTQARLENQIDTLTTRLETSNGVMREELLALGEMPARVAELGRSVDELRARSEAPQRVWIRAEAMYLLELANRRLRLEGDLATAIAAMESADARLATLSDTGVVNVRSQLAKEIAALRAVQRPDLAKIYARIAQIEESAASLPVRGVPIAAATRSKSEQKPEGTLGRARSRFSQATRDLFSLRRVDPETARIVTQEEEALRRQHLGLLLFSARIAVMQHDGEAYVGALRAAGTWLEEFFDGSDPDVAAARDELASLATIRIETPLPPVGEAMRTLQGVIGNSPEAQ
jgi:uroporphyrin-3 C-methyltransferase